MKKGFSAGRALALRGAAALLLASLLPAAVVAKDDQNFSAAITGGTLGIGPQIGYRFSKLLGVRGDATFLTVSRSADVDDITYDASLKLKSFGVMLDAYPFGGGFRVSGGARINGNRAPIEATPTTDVEVGDEVFSPSEIGTLSGTIQTNSFSPALTIGYGGGTGKGFLFGIDAGILLQGAPRINDLSATGTLANDPDFQDQLAAEELKIEDEISNYKVYPIIQISLGWRF